MQMFHWRRLRQCGHDAFWPAAGMLLIAAMLPLAYVAHAQTSFPTKSLHVIIPFAPGGSSDFVARIVTAKFAESLGQLAIIDNRAGAAGNIGMETAAKSLPDGYTLFLGNVGTVVINPWIFSSLKVDPLRDFEAVTRLAQVPGLLVTNLSFPPNTVTELVAYAKSHPGTINYSSPGVGGAAHMMMELFKIHAKIDFNSIPYKGGAGQAATALVGGETSLAFSGIASVISFIKAGRLKALATLSPNRLASLPDVPTMIEAGYPSVVDSQWQGIFVPRGTARGVVDRLNSALVDIMQQRDTRERLLSGGALSYATAKPAEFAAFVAEENKRWSAIVKEIGAKVD